ncbi:hypothetical protein MHEI_27690 [Mycobacterium heidelbergense]|nr:hypothetical protein MHEI_27690 [Mycobacterium heidelbergense]
MAEDPGEAAEPGITVRDTAVAAITTVAGQDPAETAGTTFAAEFSGRAADATDAPVTDQDAAVTASPP